MSDPYDGHPLIIAVPNQLLNGVLGEGIEDMMVHIFAIVASLVVLAVLVVVLDHVKRRKIKNQDPNELAQSVLGAGESLIQSHYFIIQKSARSTLNPGAAIALLTNQYLHVVMLKTTLKKRSDIGSHSMIPLSRISAITTTGSASLSLSFHWENNEETMCSGTQELESAIEFAENFKQLVALKETAHGATSIAEEIAQLSQLAEEGILSQAELSRAKELFLGKPKSQIDESINLLRKLKDLHKQGVLSESEFNIKKWDVLSKRDFQ